MLRRFGIALTWRRTSALLGTAVLLSACGGGSTSDAGSTDSTLAAGTTD